jgi:hypothetical protein
MKKLQMTASFKLYTTMHFLAHSGVRGDDR